MTPRPASRRNTGWQAVLAAGACALAGAGCSTPGFTADRARDAADIVTASFGLGAGAKARLGPLQLGLLFDLPQAGLRGGEWVRPAEMKHEDLEFPENTEVLIGIFGLESFQGGPLAPQRGKTIYAGTYFGVSAPVSEETIRKKAAHKAAHRKPRTPPTKLARYSPVPYFTQIEAVFGLGVTVRLGLNIGELVDFALGWAEIDMFSDDIRPRPSPTPSRRIPLRPGGPAPAGMSHGKENAP